MPRFSPVLLLVLAATGCRGGRLTPPPPAAPEESMKSPAPDKVAKSDEEWRRQLTPEQYHVTREKGTERAFTGKYWETTTPGTYRCTCCGAVLFRSEDKFEAGCGWPSFTEPAKGAGITETEDRSYGMSRTEVTCTRCGAHLGHVFDDGPGPTHLRYCINSVSIDLEEDAKRADAAKAAGAPPPATK